MLNLWCCVLLCVQGFQQSSQPWWKIKVFVWEPVLFGTWDGVFTTCMINIFGVVLFLRTGYLVVSSLYVHHGQIYCHTWPVGHISAHLVYVMYVKVRQQILQHVLGWIIYVNSESVAAVQDTLFGGCLVTFHKLSGAFKHCRKDDIIVVILPPL